MTQGVNMADANDDDAGLLYGVPAIAQFLGLRDRQTYHLVEKGLPVFRVGNKVCARRATLRTWLADQETASHPMRTN